MHTTASQDKLFVFLSIFSGRVSVSVFIRFETKNSGNKLLIFRKFSRGICYEWAGVGVIKVMQISIDFISMAKSSLVR